MVRRSAVNNIEEMPPKKGSAGAELKATRTKVKVLKKQLKEMTAQKLDASAREKLLVAKLSAKDAQLALSAAVGAVRVEKSLAHDSPVATSVATAQEVEQTVPSVEGAVRNPTPQDPLQTIQPAAGVVTASGSCQAGAGQQDGKDAALQNVVGQKFRRPKITVEKLEKPVFVPPVQNGFVAIRGIDHGRMYRPTWYFATVKNGVIQIRRKLSKGVVIGIPTSGLDDIEVSGSVKVDALPKVNQKWFHPQHQQHQKQQQQDQQRKEIHVESAAAPMDSKSEKLPSSPSVKRSDAKAATTQVTVAMTADTLLEVPTSGVTKEKKVSAAQRVSDSDAWDEIRPMVSDALAEEVKGGIKADQEEVFRSRCEGGSFAAVAKGRFLTTLKMRKDPVQDLASRALAKSTVLAHKRVLRALIKLPEKFWELNLDRAMEQYFLEEKAARRWLPTTTVVKMANAHGALRLLPLYVEGELPVLMRESVIWMQAMKAVAKSAKQMPPQQPTAAKWSEIVTAIKEEPAVPVRMALLTTWLAFGRGGDVLLLKPSDVVMTSRESAKGVSEGMAVSFWKGKTVKTRGSYTVFTQRPPAEYLREFEAYVESMRASPYLFKGVTGAQIKVALRRANPLLEQRSLRRGALQAVAATGVSDTEMLHYSGHTNVAMLRRYLNFGKLSGEGAKLSEQAAALVKRL